MPNSLLISGLQVALAEAVLWRWQAEQRHGPRRIAKHPELSGLLPLPACKVQSAELRLLCLNNLRVRGAEKDLAAAVGRRKPRDPRWNPRRSPDGIKGVQDGAQMEAKDAKIDSQDRIQAIQLIPEEMPGT